MLMTPREDEAYLVMMMTTASSILEDTMRTPSSPVKFHVTCMVDRAAREGNDEVSVRYPVLFASLSARLLNEWQLPVALYLAIIQHEIVNQVVT